MKRILYSALSLLIATQIVSAQFNKAELQVAGLTCSLCSKSTENQLKKLNFIDSMSSNLSQATFILYFKKDSPVDFEEIKRKVNDAGFSIALLKATCMFDNLLIDTNGRFNYQHATFCIINKYPRVLNGETVLQFVDAGFVTKREYKKYAGKLTKYATSKKMYGYHVIYNPE